MPNLPPFLQALANASPQAQDPKFVNLFSILGGMNGQPPSQPPQQPQFGPSGVSNNLANMLATGATSGLFDISKVFNAAQSDDPEAFRAVQNIDPTVIQMIQNAFKQAMMSALSQGGTPMGGLPPTPPTGGMPPRG